MHLRPLLRYTIVIGLVTWLVLALTITACDTDGDDQNATPRNCASSYTCVSDSECPSGHRCNHISAGSFCQELYSGVSGCFCSHDLFCAEMHACNEGYPEPICASAPYEKGSPCGANEECALGLLCNFGTAQPTCVEQSELTVPVTIAADQPMDPPLQRIHSLTGIHGAPVTAVEGDSEVKNVYWGRPPASGEPDGAHVNLVRMGTDTTCDVSLERIFPEANANPEDPANYNFDTLDAHIEAIDSLNTAEIMWQAAFNPGLGGQCLTDGAGTQLGKGIVDAAAGDLFTTVTINTLKHLRKANGPSWDQSGLNYPVRYVEFFADPFERVGYNDGNVDTLFPKFQSLAGAIHTWYTTPGQSDSKVLVGGIGFVIRDASQLDFTSNSDKHALLRFIDYCASYVVPLDFVSFQTRTASAQDAAAIAVKIREYLDTQSASSAHKNTRLILTNAEVDWNSPTLSGVLEEDPKWLQGFSAAFQSATRIAMQDVPIDGFISGRSVRVHGDLDGGDPIIESPLIDSEATATPTLISMLPFRQVGGQERVPVSVAHNSHDLSIVASHPYGNSQRLNVIITNTTRTITSAPITYHLQLMGMPAPTEGNITYKLAILNQDSQGLDDFRFTEAGKTTPSAEGGWTLSHAIGLNETHYVEFTSP